MPASGCTTCFFAVWLLGWTSIVLVFDAVFLGGAYYQVWPAEPTDPAKARIHRGVLLAMLWFLTPFNVIMIGGWVWAARARRPAFDPTDSRAVVPTATGYRVRLFDLGRSGVFAVVMLVITFCGTFLWGFALAFGFNPPVALVWGSYVVVVIVALVVALRHVPPWMEVDEVARVFRLPATPQTIEVPFATVRAVVVVHEEHKDSEGDIRHQYHCDLIRMDTSSLRVTTYNNEAGAEAFAAWLRERIGRVRPREVASA